MAALYVLRLVDNKYYVGTTNRNVIKCFDDHCNGEGRGTEWTRLHKPIDIEECRRLGENEDKPLVEQKKTFEYMLKYGTANVRGGATCQVAPLDLDALAFQIHFFLEMDLDIVKAQLASVTVNPKRRKSSAPPNSHSFSWSSSGDRNSAAAHNSKRARRTGGRMKPCVRCRFLIPSNPAKPFCLACNERVEREKNPNEDDSSEYPDPSDDPDISDDPGTSEYPDPSDDPDISDDPGTSDDPDTSDDPHSSDDPDTSDDPHSSDDPDTSDDPF